ncbi:aldose epimerase family protein [Solimonas marina]|uniref:Aldose 1-epimerase n=1 Tax=Solimonas marina TaxID=2714601 RepID=A0A969WBP2_9GAMM|nr:aldose epimerase family protein [Solimonas marina]NKF24212.1 galactose mutarotase [Solimonas marina]
MKREFGTLDGGTPIHAYTLRSEAGLSAEILDYGGILRSLRYPGRGGSTELVLGLPTLADYRRDPSYLGIIAGRFANRIAAGRYTLDGASQQLSVNEGPNHLHGGQLGLGRRVWTVLDDASDGARSMLRLAYRSPAGEEGYPGNVDITATFTLDGSRLTLQLDAQTDAPTPINLTYHPYFNLGGDGHVPAAEQRLEVPADRYLPVDAALLPSGEVASVAGTPFDFRRERPIAHPLDDARLVASRGYDHCLVLADDATYSARIVSPRSGIGMTVRSNKPAIQVYEGQGLDAQHPELGRGVCLEPQDYPDAPNHPQFPSAILRPGYAYRHTIELTFAAAAG